MNVFIEPSNDYEGQHSLDKAPWTGLNTGDPTVSILHILVSQAMGYDRSDSKFYPISIQRSGSNNLCLKFNCDVKIINFGCCFKRLTCSSHYSGRWTSIQNRAVLVKNHFIPLCPHEKLTLRCLISNFREIFRKIFFYLDEIVSLASYTVFLKFDTVSILPLKYGTKPQII